ncbi:MAG TPA: hypothetical protein VI981_00230 [Candidatus Paceibacterota bacterium]
MNRVLANTYTIERQQKLFWLIAIAVGLTLLFYGYLVNRTVFNVASWGRDNSELSKTRSTIGELELAYFDSKNNISPEMARKIGFSEVVTPIFISRTQIPSVISLNTREKIQ